MTLTLRNETLGPLVSPTKDVGGEVVPELIPERLIEATLVMPSAARTIPTPMVENSNHLRKPRLDSNAIS